MSLGHSQRDLVAQEVGIMHQVSYSSSVSTFCRNELKDRNITIRARTWLAPPTLDVIFVANFPQPPLNHSREKEFPPL